MWSETRPGRSLEALAGALFCSILAVGSLASVPELQLQGDMPIELRIENDATVVVSGLGDDARLRQAARFTAGDWRDLLHVVARDPNRTAEGADLPPLLGSYSLDGSNLRFKPRFSPTPGLVIEASFAIERWAGRSDSRVLTASYLVPRPEVERTAQVEAIYPATQTVPANLLRFYVHFSAAMSARHVLPQIELLDGGGNAIETAFVEVEGGLWDPSRSRLTLFIHAGRVKRGVGPNQALGPVLEEGKNYTLRVGEQALDAHGRHLVETYEHRFTAGPEDHVSPSPVSWTLEPPRSSDEPLRVSLVEPADVALLQRMPAVLGDAGRPVAGRIDVSKDGSSFAFLPEGAWEPGNYELWVPAALEDPSGNRIGRKFEETRSSTEVPQEPPTVLGFQVLLSGG
ncbi:MAG: hypothetical protein MPN21_10970 [Thermoanaerobaculia bacterium]|nr:hypothetical protein [Thermoanaerobaculia bacterium]